LFQEMIRMEIPDYTETDPLKHPDFQAEPKAKIAYIVALDEKAKALRVKGNGQADYLMAADTCYQIVLNQIEQIRKGFRSEETKLEIQQQAREFYTRALENCLDLYQLTGNKGYLNRAFSISEKSKTAALYEGIQMSKLRQNSNVPMEVLETETRIRVNIHRLEENIFELENQETEEDSSLLARYWAEKYFLQQKHDSILLFLEKSHPDFDLKSHQQTIISPTAIQAKLSQKQAFITYYLTDSVLHGFVITDVDFQYFSKKLKSNFSQKLWDYRKMLTNPQADVYPASNYLYRILIEPAIGQIDEKNLIIAPDGILATLPFETLITKLPGKDLPVSKALEFLLIRKRTISYTYSSTFFLEDRKTSSGSLETLAFAPVFNTIQMINAESNRDCNTNITGEGDTLRGSLIELRGANREVGLLSQILKTKTFIGEEATEELFKKYAPGYGILHLATHAIINSDNPMNSYLVFTPNKDTTHSGEDNNLYAWELYNMELKAQMAVLSACNTGFGKLRRGEGVMSLGRAFAYAGVPSIVMSLWPADDESTADLMGYFYEGLADGQPKDEALRNAKLRFLAEMPPSKHHPFYWAGFVVHGDAGPLEKKEMPVWGWLLIGAIVLATLSFFISRKRTRV
ncbi:MAG: CHAT domain-containing protein, partial [Bacteroidetes bacterium]|nr:CHAT domain-containing protein [Bacteroidota bacterium]